MRIGEIMEVGYREGGPVKEPLVREPVAKPEPKQVPVDEKQPEVIKIDNFNKT